MYYVHCATYIRIISNMHSLCSVLNMKSAQLKQNIGQNKNKKLSYEVDDFGTNRKHICNFLLVRHSNLGPVLHRFWDTATYWLNIANLASHSLIRHPGSVCALWNFALKLTAKKIQSWHYPPDGATEIARTDIARLDNVRPYRKGGHRETWQHGTR